MTFLLIFFKTNNEKSHKRHYLNTKIFFEHNFVTSFKVYHNFLCLFSAYYIMY